MAFKNLICNTSLPQKRYHDDMFNEDVKIVPFPYMNQFGDFRVFNGLQLRYMDEMVGRIREIMVDIANERACHEREEQLRGER